MTRKETDRLDEVECVALLELWNNNYPSSIAFENIAALNDYLIGLEKSRHTLLVDTDSGEIKAWFSTFLREEERWFAMIVDASVQREGIGSKLLSEAQHNHEMLNGWVIDHDRERLADGSPYLSPLPFYIGLGFEVLFNERLTTEKLDTVKVCWQRSPL